MLRTILNFLRNTRKPTYQLSFIVIASCLALIILQDPLQKFKSYDLTPILSAIDPKVLKEFGEPTVVKAGLHIINFPEFDILKNKFVLDGIIWFEFNPSLISLETIAKFSFEKGELLYLSEPDTKIVDNKLFARYNFRLQFSSNLDFRAFPLDDHRINFILTNDYITPSELIYNVQISGFTIAENLFVPGWNIKDLDVSSGYSREKLDENDTQKEVIYPQILFSIDLKHAGTRDLSAIFLPLFMLFFMGLIGLSLNLATSASAMLSIATGSLSGTIVYRFVIQNMSPTTGYFMISDQVFILFLTLEFIIFIFGVTLAYYQKYEYDFSLAQSIIIITLYIFVLTAWYFLLR